MKKIIINITKNDIKKAKKEIKKGYDYGFSCPVAQALKRTELANREVFDNTPHISGCNDIYLPEEIVNYIEDFDSDEPIKPTSFILEYCE